MFIALLVIQMTGVVCGHNLTCLGKSEPWNTVHVHQNQLIIGFPDYTFISVPMIHLLDGDPLPFAVDLAKISTRLSLQHIGGGDETQAGYFFGRLSQSCSQPLNVLIVFNRHPNRYRLCSVNYEQSGRTFSDFVIRSFLGLKFCVEIGQMSVTRDYIPLFYFTDSLDCLSALFKLTLLEIDQDSFQMTQNEAWSKLSIVPLGIQLVIKEQHRSNIFFSQDKKHVYLTRNRNCKDCLPTGFKRNNIAAFGYTKPYTKIYILNNEDSLLYVFQEPKLSSVSQRLKLGIYEQKYFIYCETRPPPPTPDMSDDDREEDVVTFETQKPDQKSNLKLIISIAGIIIMAAGLWYALYRVRNNAFATMPTLTGPSSHGRNPSSSSGPSPSPGPVKPKLDGPQKSKFIAKCTAKSQVAKCTTKSQVAKSNPKSKVVGETKI